MIRAVRTALQVTDYARRLAPETRRAVKQALKGLGHDRGDIRVLEGNLAGFHRLRVGRHRLIFAYRADDLIDVLFIEERRLVYEIFEAEFIAKLKSPKRR